VISGSSVDFSQDRNPRYNSSQKQQTFWRKKNRKESTHLYCEESVTKALVTPISWGIRRQMIISSLNRTSQEEIFSPPEEFSHFFSLTLYFQFSLGFIVTQI